MNLSDEGIQSVLIGVMALLFVVIVWLLVEFKGMKDEIKTKLKINNDTQKIRLQAYERLTLFTDRASLKSLVNRTPSAGLNVVDLQLTFIDQIKSEYEYNVSQQIYVSADMWKAINNLKDQNIFVINQLAAQLPSASNGIELSKSLLQYAATPNAELNTIVLDALQHEAKQIF
jgi:hypothetical protein